MIWVSVHVASWAIVASSSAADSVSPQRSMILRVGIPFDPGLPTSGGGGHEEVVQYCTTAQNHLAASDVGMVPDPGMIGEQMQNAVLEDPSPRLAVVQ